MGNQADLHNGKIAYLLIFNYLFLGKKRKDPRQNCLFCLDEIFFNRVAGSGCPRIDPQFVVNRS
jgi:hypothetical protein